MERVVRLFTSEIGTVRWETSIVATEGLEFRVWGPQLWSTSVMFPDAKALMRHQSQYEDFLLDSGFELLPVEERRTVADRRTCSRDGRDRRRLL